MFKFREKPNIFNIGDIVLLNLFLLDLLRYEKLFRKGIMLDTRSSLDLMHYLLRDLIEDDKYVSIEW